MYQKQKKRIENVFVCLRFFGFQKRIENVPNLIENVKAKTRNAKKVFLRFRWDFRKIPKT